MLPFVVCLSAMHLMIALFAKSRGDKTVYQFNLFMTFWVPFLVLTIMFLEGAL
jgi:hypothetical protein